MISTDDLSKSYDATQALQGVSFSINEHEVVGLLGPNGAGKTTLMKILTGYLHPSGGLATIDGIDVTEAPLAVQERIGYLPENAPLYPDMLVQEYLQMMADLRQIAAERQPELISEAVRRTALQDYLVRPIGHLSKGYRQRVGLAQAILHRPKVLILDEPTSGLDPNQIVEIRKLIRKLAKEATVLLSTHILSEVELTCERVLIISEGKLRTDARLDELQGAEGAVVAIEAGAQRVEEALQSIPGAKGVEQRGVWQVGTRSAGFLTYRVKGNSAEICPAIYDLARERGWRLAELRPDQKTLESIFRGIDGRTGGAA